jgi:spermidine synthase
MLISTIFFGMSLPIASRIANRDMKLLGRTVGGIFSINTMGSVTGALLTGLILIPQLGVKLTLETGLLLNGLLGVFLLFKAGVGKRLKMSVLFSALLLFAGYMVLFPGWNQNFLISGVYRNLHVQELPSYIEFKEQQNEGHKILWYKEGVDANEAVRESVFGDTIQRSLVINGKADASTIADLETQALLVQLPLMLHPNTPACSDSDVSS